MTVSEIAAIMRPQYEHGRGQDELDGGHANRRAVLAEWDRMLESAEPDPTIEPVDDLQEAIESAIDSWERHRGRVRHRG